MMRITVLMLLITGAAVQAQSAGGAGATAGRLAECAAQSACATILKSLDEGELVGLSDSARLFVAVMQGSAAMAALRTNHDRQIAGAGYCFRTRVPIDSTLIGIAAAPMQSRLPRLRVCRSDEALPNPPRRGRVLPEPGSQVVGLLVSSIAANVDNATARFTIGSTGYVCELVRTSRIWRPETCSVVGTG